MRAFQDSQGRRWQAALLEASYGQILLILSDGVLQAVMSAEHLAEAEAQLAALDDDALRALLAQAAPWGG
jgi:hypothetical protein